MVRKDLHPVLFLIRSFWFVLGEILSAEVQCVLYNDYAALPTTRFWQVAY